MFCSLASWKEKPGKIAERILYNGVRFNLLFQELEKINLDLISSTLKLIFSQVFEKVSWNGIVINASNFLCLTCTFFPLTHRLS